jgi:hypothetical protein
VKLDLTVELDDDDDGYNAKYKYVSPQYFRIAFQYGMQRITQMPNQWPTDLGRPLPISLFITLFRRECNEPIFPYKNGYQPGR